MVKFSNSTLYNNRGAWSIDERELKALMQEKLEQANHKESELAVYLMDESYTQYGSSRGVLRIFLNASPNESYKQPEEVVTPDKSFVLQAYVPHSLDGVVALKDENGTVMAYQEKEKNVYYIPFELDEVDYEILHPVVLHALDVIIKEGIEEIANKNSWMKRKDKKELVSTIVANFSSSYTEQERLLTRTLDRLNSDIEAYKRSLKDKFDAFKKASKELVMLKKTDDSEEIRNFINGLDKIAEHPAVSSLDVDGDLVTIGIDNVYAYSDVKGEEKRFYIGNMTVEININNTDVRFKGDNKRRGYWGQDPHPHVNGNDGRACLGNVASSIAELCSQKEIYGLFLIAKDFLENANYDDPAGRKVIMWDEVDKDGHIIKEGGVEYECSCEHCGEGIEEGDDVYTVYTGFDDGELENDENWCEGCKDDRASWADCVEEYVHDEIVDEVAEYFEENEEAYL